MQFARRNWRTFLSLDDELGGSRPHRAVVAVTTDCRALGNEAAAGRTSAAITRLMSRGVERIFLKIDSTLRGSVPGQIAGALAAWRARHADASALVCPAYPRMGRTVEKHRLLVHGEPVEQTAFGRDPVSPIATSDVTALIPISDDVTLADAASDDDLRQLARTVAAAGPAMIAVGSGGLAAALAEQLSLAAHATEPSRPSLPRIGATGRVLMLVTSLNPLSHVQADRVSAAGGDITVLRAPVERVSQRSVAEQLAAKFADLALRERWDLFGLVGGDGARAALRCIAASGIWIIDSAIEGIPVGMVAGGPCDGTPVFTKAGGFGDQDALVRAIGALRS